MHGGVIHGSVDLNVTSVRPGRIAQSLQTSAPCANAIEQQVGLPKEVLDEGARKLGMLHGDTFVFDSEDETSVLMDYCIYNVFRQGRNAIDRYLCDCPPDPASDEMVCLRAMQHAKYALLVVLSVERGVGLHVRDLLTDGTHFLVDIGFSQTAERNAVLATFLLPRLTLFLFLPAGGCTRAGVLAKAE